MTAFNSHLTLKNNNNTELGKNFTTYKKRKKKRVRDTCARGCARAHTQDNSIPSYNTAYFVQY